MDKECEVLRSLRHRNLVKVITSCSNLDFKALVLEYMPNGNLDKYLYSHNYFLDIRQRLSIMIDVARALEYFHHGCSSPVIQCDIKPSNVLLDEDMVAQLSDFGISKLLGEDESDLYTKTLATFGYIAPGRIPRDFGNLTFLVSLDLGSNHFHGNLPQEMAHLRRLKFLDLSLNSFRGEIPSWFGFLHQLQVVNLRSNSFTGSIPPSLSNASRLETLQISANLLQGNIPEEIGNLHNLNWLSIENNQLTVISQYSKSLFINKQASWSYAYKLVKLFKLAKTKRRTRTLECRFQLQIEHFSCNGSPTSENAFVNRAKTSRTNQITDSLSESTNLIGSGSFGSVYKGVLRSGTAIAVKVFNLQLEAAFKSFDTECEVLRSLRHRNLVKVITSCSNLDFKALVLEYMPNGSLDKYLYSHNYFLGIRQRLSIMIDVACSLEYLHHGCPYPVIHCDIKPSNVLLDEDMVAHLSHFGISKLLGEDESDLYTKTLATFGYIAPEYGLDGLVLVKCNVYSYGIMLLETFTRTKPSDFEGDLNLKQWVSYSLPEAVKDVIDANLVTPLDNRLQKKLDVVASIMKVALDCCAESPARRTNMKDVVGMLQKIKIQLLHAEHVL
ncbi:hypothetical protein MTR67_020839 [Solanum verrucosum]|uniref:non-specific serine/threonine protein kinase n=1 Tax=Solanum verrucosum TaxID=315347 RepID=A0AAF0QWZ4_SOLVR|nr:hypothetical protein MTR67_020839 [Solanum verrucosum]